MSEVEKDELRVLSKVERESFDGVTIGDAPQEEKSEAHWSGARIYYSHGIGSVPMSVKKLFMAANWRTRIGVLLGVGILGAILLFALPLLVMLGGVLLLLALVWRVMKR